MPFSKQLIDWLSANWPKFGSQNKWTFYGRLVAPLARFMQAGQLDRLVNNQKLAQNILDKEVSQYESKSTGVPAGSSKISGQRF